jgi:quercetin dioxygenase-like cupin family protein
MKRYTLTLAALIGLIVPATAQQPMAPNVQGITRTPLKTIDVPTTGAYEAVSGIAQVPANTCVTKHTHPGPENSYVLEGEIVMKVDGQPDLKLKAGDGFTIPTGVPHVGCAVSNVKLFTVHIVEKGKPLATPVQ